MSAARFLRDVAGRILALALVLLAVCPSCAKRPRHRPLPSDAGLTGGQLLFQDDFEAGLDNWTTESKNWRIEQGRLFTGDRANENRGLWLEGHPLPPNVRIEFDASSGKGNNPVFEGDIKCEFGGETAQHASGYLVIFGGWKNTVNTIAKNDEHGEGRLAVDTSRKVEEGRAYRFAVVRLGNEVKWFLDGQLVLRVVDSEPLSGGAFGFNNWNSRVHFDNLRIFAL